MPLAVEYGPDSNRLRRNEVMRVDDKLLGCSLVEILVALRRIVERDHRYVHRLRNLNAVMQYRLHELPVITHNRTLTGGERV